MKLRKLIKKCLKWKIFLLVSMCIVIYFTTFNIGILGGKVKGRFLLNIGLTKDASEALWNSDHADNTARNQAVGFRYKLTEILMVRIYAHDKAQWTIRELKQWIHFMLYAGVEHIYVCDHFVEPDERLDGPLHLYIKAGLVTYLPWPWNASNNAGNIMKHQVLCYRTVVQQYGYLSKWQLSMDMDEYPVVMNDTGKGFLTRFLDRIPDLTGPDSVSQLLLPNYLMLGQGDRSKVMVIERINRVTLEKPNELTKPLYRPAAIRNPDIHVHSLQYGRQMKADPSGLRMLHYWGARMQDWGPDTEKVLKITKELDFMKGEIARGVRQSLLDFNETDAFSNSTGP